MKESITVPPLAESITEVIVGAFLIKEGAFVEEGAEMVELETEKVNQVLYAPFSGVVSWSVKEGDTLSVGEVIGSLESSKAPPQKKEAPAQLEPQKKTPSKIEPQEQAPLSGIRYGKEHFISTLSDEDRSISKPPTSSEESLKISSEKPEKVMSVPPEKEKRLSRKKMGRVRKTIAKRLVGALQTAAMLTTFNEADMSAIMALRKKYQDAFMEKHGVKLGFMSFFVKAIVEGLKAFPQFNAFLEGDEIVTRHFYDINIAVGTEKGLFVPLLRECESLSFAEIERAILDYAKKAREGTLSIQDLESGSFTITNGGVYGSLLSTPILNPPQVGILGMHKIEKRPIVIEDDIVVRPMMYLALSYDHRLVDGKEAVSFLVHVKELLESPERLLFFKEEG